MSAHPSGAKQAGNLPKARAMAYKDEIERKETRGLC